MSYDRSITVFAPDGNLKQVEYALEAVKKGAAAVGIKGKESVILAVERRAQAKLQDARTVKKICLLDSHLTIAFAGLQPDARVLVNRARIEAQSHRLRVEDAATPEYMARYIANIQQRYTQTGGRRPFGISMLLAGHDVDGTPHLFQMDPSGVYSEWKATAVGRHFKSLREFLEKEHEPDMEEADAVKLAVKTLLEIVDRGSNNIEVAIMRPGQRVHILSDEDVTELTEAIDAENEAAGAAAEGGAAAAGTAQ